MGTPNYFLFSLNGRINKNELSYPPSIWQPKLRVRADET